ncbi:hypothetical protein ACXX9E_28865 [Pseudomonas sp. GNP014]
MQQIEKIDRALEISAIVAVERERWPSESARMGDDRARAGLHRKGGMSGLIEETKRLVLMFASQ